MRIDLHLCVFSKYVYHLWRQMEVWKCLFYLLVNLQEFILLFHFLTAFSVVLTTHSILTMETSLFDFVVYHYQSFSFLLQTRPFWIVPYYVSFLTTLLLPLYFQLSKILELSVALPTILLTSDYGFFDWHWMMCRARARYQLIGQREGYLKCLQKHSIN